MSSIRFHGTAEKFGEITTIPSQELESDPTRGEVTIHQLIESVPLGQTALLNSEFQIPGSGSNNSRARASFVAIDELGLGRNEGQHESVFGQMIINGRGLHERPTLIAVKPFNENVSPEHNSRTLAHEWTVNGYLNSLSSRQLAYLPLGVRRVTNQINQLITLYEHDVKSYDHVFWANRDINPEALRPETLKLAYADCIRGLGYLHGVGIAHHDAEVKNLASDRMGARFIDMEDSVKLPRTGSTIKASGPTIGLVRNDIELFFDSSVQVEENRPAIVKVLSSRSFTKRLAQLYRSGLRSGQRDSGLKIPELDTSTDGYFEKTTGYTLAVAANMSDTA